MCVARLIKQPNNNIEMWCNNPKWIGEKKNNTIAICLPSLVITTYLGGESSSPFHYNGMSNLHKKISIELQELSPKSSDTQISSRGQETQFDLVYPRWTKDDSSKPLELYQEQSSLKL
jgi:hypothetical protein